MEDSGKSFLPTFSPSLESDAGNTVGSLSDKGLIRFLDVLGDVAEQALHGEQLGESDNATEDPSHALIRVRYHSTLSPVRLDPSLLLVRS